MINIVQIGTGQWGASWARDVLPKVHAVNVVGYVDTNAATLAAFGEKLNVSSKCFSSLKAALTAVECDIVLAALRTDAHYSVVKEALEAGKHVIVEKPFASTLEEAKALNTLAAQAGRLLMVSQNYRFSSAQRTAAKLLAEEKLGKVNFVTLDLRKHGPTFGFLYWEIPDPLVADMSIHHFDLMRMLFGEICRVSARTWNTPGSKFLHAPSCFTAIEFHSGLMLSYRASFMSSGPDTPWGGVWTANCTEGEIVWSSRSDGQGQDEGTLALRPLRGELAEVSLDPLVYKDRAGSVAAFAEAVSTGVIPDFLPLGSDNIRSLAVVKACLSSAAEQGAWVRLSDILAD